MELFKEAIISWDEEEIKFNGKTFHRGDEIFLKDLLQDEITKTEYWGIKSSNSLNIINPSKKDYSSVYLFQKEENEKQTYVLARLHRLLGNSNYCIKRIGQFNNESLIQIDDNILIDLGNPKVYKEIEINKKSVLPIENEDKETLLDIVECYDLERLGLFTKKEIENILEDKFRYYMSYIQKKWDLKIIPPFFRTPFRK